MIAPVVALGLVPRFYGIDTDGLPQLDCLDVHGGCKPAAIIVSHLFDRARSLHEARVWCDRHGITMIEDCAHAPIGMAGERPAGHWGDLATASVTKFAAVPEMGLLGSSRGVPSLPRLSAPGFSEQVRAVWIALDRAAPHSRPAALHFLVRWLGRQRSGRAPAERRATAGADTQDVSVAMLAACDMSRADHGPTWMARALAATAFDGGAAKVRRNNHAALLAAVDGMSGVRPLYRRCPDDAAPYAVPLWVEEADSAYERLRQAGEAVYRWDRVWPGTPNLIDDQAPSWRRHVLQCLCHQDLSPQDMQRLARRLGRGASR
jgi:perosamine synthetase